MSQFAPPGDLPLRRLLGEAMKSPLAEAETCWQRIMRFPDHLLRLVESDPEKMQRSNCFAFALGLPGDARYERLVDLWQSSVLANSSFFEWLIESGALLPRQEGTRQVGDIVVYFAGGSPRHAARIADQELLLSKWGTREVLEHRLWEVPICYGDSERAYAPIPVDQAMLLLGAWQDPP